ncbi:hypothetical protein T492DRAFT_887598 [Pavlovales sp. CCMP2436]|nr:hypothetical protein T492DRAFT_887598 [Pavlovales sp. CCMP2436]
MAESGLRGGSQGETLVLTWGRGCSGELGRGEVSAADAVGSVAPVPDLVGKRVVRIASGMFHCTAITAQLGPFS